MPVEIKNLAEEVIYTVAADTLAGANLSCAYLRGADLSDTDLSDTNLSRADLSGADLSDTNLSRADLSGADLRHADLSYAYLRGADLEGAILPYDVAPLPGLRKQILAAVEASPTKGLDLSEWHTCETTHCLAGWATHLHPQGKELEDKLGAAVAGALIFYASEGEVPNFYSSTAEALEWLKK